MEPSDVRIRQSMPNGISYIYYDCVFIRPVMVKYNTYTKYLKRWSQKMSEYDKACQVACTTYMYYDCVFILLEVECMKYITILEY